MGFVFPRYYCIYLREKNCPVTSQLLQRAKSEINAGKGVEFNGTTYTNFDILLTEIEIYCKLQELK